ncbi:hypothetical protein QYE76_036042 [Lolium multiflorum]|uniref:Retrotransposon gag domain-containing protein n=1 Tax=Lolium multiflorum TaxID=4521 RepID=A0AAD8R2U8_LOLMU|nr:hypothetical protein QYE76_036042 [Lolium multiflorum]
MDIQPHPELKHHVEHLDFILYHTQQDLDHAREYANQTHAHIIQQGEAIKMLAKDRRTLRQQRTKKDATITRLREKIAALEATVKAQEEKMKKMEEDGEDIQGGGAFLGDDDDFEEDENTEEEDYEFLDAGEDDYIPIDVDEEIMKRLQMAPPTRNANQETMMQMLQVMLEDREAERAEIQANIAALQQLANNNQGHHDHPGSKLKNFQNTNTPVFSKTEEPLDADDWLQTMENNLEVAGVEANEKVLFDTHYLAGPARAWWTSTRTRTIHDLGRFQAQVQQVPCAPGLIKKMRDEFRELKQGGCPWWNTATDFDSLKVRPDETDTTEKEGKVSERT